MNEIIFSKNTLDRMFSYSFRMYYFKIWIIIIKLISNTRMPFISLLLKGFDLSLVFKIHVVGSEMNESILTKLRVCASSTRVYK